MSQQGKKAEGIRQRFVREYLVDCNATQAYIRAGGSPNGASVEGSRTLAIPSVSAEIQKAQKSLADKLGITAEAVLRELASLAFSNMADFVTLDEKGEPYVDLRGLDHRRGAALTELTTRKYFDKSVDAQVTETKIKLHEKRSALETLGKHLGVRGMGLSKVEVTGKDGAPVSVNHLHGMTDAQLAAIAAGAQ